MKNLRTKKRKNKWFPQRRFHFLFIIPTPFWFDLWDSYGDLVLGDILEPISFDTEKECDIWLTYEGN